MATTEEIVVKYRLELDELKAQVNTLNDQLKKTDDTAKQTGKNFEQAFGKLGDQLKNLGKAVVAAFAVERIVAFGKESVAAFAEAEKGALKLRSAVTAGGGLQADFERLTNQAEKLAAITIFDDDQIKAAQTLALQFGLNANAVEKLIPRVADFAAATGQDLNQALQATLGGINGQVDGLKRYGLELDTSATKNERFAAVVEQLTGKFNGQAEALTQTLGGAVGQAEKAFGELQETVGAALAPAVTAAAQALTGLFNAFQGAPENPLQAEVEQLGILRIRLTEANLPAEDRVRIIRELQEKYPAYLGSLDAEKAKNEDLLPALKQINDALINKIVLSQEDAKVQAAAEKKAAAVKELIEKQTEAELLLSKAAAAGVDLSDSRLTLEEKITKALNDRGLKRQATGGIAIDAETRLLRDLTQISFGLVYANEAVAQSDQELTASREKRADVEKRLGLVLKTETADQVNTVTTGLEKKTQAEIDAEKKANEEKAKARKEARQKELEAAQKQAEDELKIREQLAKDSLAQDLANLDANDAERKRAVEQRFNDETNAARAAALQQQADLLQQLQAGLISYEEYTKKKQAILSAVPNTEKQQQAALLREDIRSLELRIQNQADYNVKDEKLAQDLADKKAALAQLNTDIEADAAAARIATAEQEAQIKAELVAKENEERQKFTQQALQQAGALLDGISQLTQTIGDQQIEELTKQGEEQRGLYDQQQADLDQQLQKRLISQAEYERKSADIKQLRASSEKQVSDKITAIRRKQDLAAKASALFRIGVDTATAAIAVLKDVPPPPGFVLQGAIIAAGLLAAANVLAQKPPQYAEGIDYVPLGRNRPGRDTIPAYLDEGERVISRRKNLKNWDLYQAIDQDRLDQYIFRQYTLPTLLAEKARGGDVARALGSVFGASSSNAGGLDSGELRRLWRKGLPITNLDELAQVLTRNTPSPYRA